MTEPLPRYEATRRRDFLRRTALLGTVGLVPALAGCSDDDAELRTSSPATTTSAVPTTTVAPPTTGTEITEAPTTTAAAADVLPAGAALDLSFTYAASAEGFGPVRNPFIVAWVEDGDGNLVRNLSLWYNPPKGNRWVNQLSTWYAADEAYYSANGSDDLEAVTGASRPAGQYTLRWDGNAEDGSRAVAGTYRVLVESAREHGPHSLISTTVAVGSSGAQATLPTDGELTGGPVTYRV